MNKKDSNHPIIGICVSEKKSDLDRLIKRRIKHFHERAIFIKFYIEDLDFHNLRVKGSYMESENKKWKEGEFPFPDVIYLQSHVDLNIVKRIEEVIGRNVFNTFTLDKFLEAKLLAEHTVLQPHLPRTQKLENEVQLQEFLAPHKNIFLKPIYGKVSIGVVRVVSKDTGNIEVFYRQNQNIKREAFHSFKDFWYWFSPNLSQKKYLMQQGIQTMTIKERATDIRLNMNKNGKGLWEVSVLLFRIACNTSHLIPGPLAVIPIRSLTRYYFKNEEIDKMEKSIQTLGFTICEALDRSGHHMADLGLDLGLDQNGHLWIFEVNTLPHPILRVNDCSLTRPLEYAYYLASNTDHKTQPSPN
ncbi:YheC/YheD family protein [Alkalihalobacterium chitinilyticum]|uniref:YheC/YheD family protein n=1 Tax=Alkalihalobacterium chitinilyticum TaxID=2980103 RepID=A0ABT5VHK8_9BACI|nr:YheC/YheD family protein [Alkalihalobacterium chitinilyticum]MDE5414237.1 YheC/YheD family protein [Alkalihalobacterium chitinilyticum]